METEFGVKAQEGDYVLVLDNDYVHRSSKNLIAKVYKGKAYTGSKTNYGFGKYIHKLTAVIVIPAEVVSEERKQAIELDILTSNKK